MTPKVASHCAQHAQGGQPQIKGKSDGNNPWDLKQTSAPKAYTTARKRKAWRMGHVHKICPTIPLLITVKYIESGCSVLGWRNHPGKISTASEVLQPLKFLTELFGLEGSGPMMLLNMNMIQVTNGDDFWHENSYIDYISSFTSYVHRSMRTIIAYSCEAIRCEFSNITRSRCKYRLSYL